MADEKKPEDPKKPEPSRDVVIPGPSGAVVLQGAGMFHDVSALTQAYRAAITGRCNLLAPVTRVDFIPMLHAISLRVVTFDPRPATRDNKGSAKTAGPDLYELEGDVALTKIALDKIAAAAGITWVPQHYGRLDNRSEPLYCAFQACGSMRDVDGRVRTVIRTRETDLRPNGADRKRTKSTFQLDMAAQFIEPVTESKACNRVVRAFLGIKSRYTQEEASRPFIVPTLVFDGHHEDPEIRKAVALRITEEAMLAQRTVYGGGAPALPMPTGEVELGRQAPPALPAPERDPNDDTSGAHDDDDTPGCRFCGAADEKTHMDGCPERKE